MYLAVAILIICLAHIIRVFRWELLIETYEKPDGRRLTESLSLGYFLNYFLPFKLGDLVRAVYAGKKMKNGRGFALATVIVERCLDVLTVGAMFLFMEMSGIAAKGTTEYYVILALAVSSVLVIILLLKKYNKKAIYKFGSLFNEKYEEKVLRFFWALIWGFKDILNRLPKIKLIFLTVIMWGLYLSSYWAFAMFLELSGINSSFSDVFMSLFDQKSLFSSSLSNGFLPDAESVLHAVFMIVPLVLMVTVMLFVEKYLGISRESGEYMASKRLNLLPQANADERRQFLKMYFAGEKKAYIDNYLSINRNILVLRDYSAGSNATTILCTDGRNSFYRKYAFSDAASKLSDQIEWIKSHKDMLPLPEIVKSEANEVACFYDMPYNPNAMTMFELAQSGDNEKAWEILKKVIETLEEKLYVSGESEPDNKNDSKDDSKDAEDNLNRYIKEKIVHNLDTVLSDKKLAELEKYDTIVINGSDYRNLGYYKDRFEEEKLRKVFAADKISDIHGDLTIENIVCTKDDFYLIDPNTGNIFNSRFIDYAKILQSLHGNYEYLMAVSDVCVEENRIDFKCVGSKAYEYMLGQYKKFLLDHFSEEEINSIYYHEIANWLRLMPYKLEKGRGEIFYAGLLMIMNDLKI